MTQGKKYTSQITQDGDSWKAEIIRQVTSRRTMVSKSQDGFASEAEAQIWAESELKMFMKKLSEHNKRHSEVRKEKRNDA